MAFSRLSDAVIDLSQLAPPSAVETLEVPVILANWMAQFVALEPAYTVLLESDPAVKVLEVGAYRESVLRQRINDALLALLLPTSYGSNLDALGARFKCLRLLISSGDPNAVPPTPNMWESDTSYRRRIGLAPDAWAAGGPYGGYSYQAFTADPNIIDVAIYNAGTGLVNPGSLLVSILTAKDADMSSAVQNTYTRLHRPDIQLLTDNVLVQGATPVSYTIDAILYVGIGPDPATIQATALASLNAYLTSRRKIGKPVPLSGIYAALQVGGVDRVELNSPTADVPVGITQYGEAISITTSITVGSTI